MADRPWEHTFAITTKPPRWYRREWKAIATRQRTTSGAIEIIEIPAVTLVALGATRWQAIRNVQQDIRTWAANLDERKEAAKPVLYTVNTWRTG